ncbi:MAG: class I SAM-dependent methyltransferase [Candidatus Binataceae bacterium]
MEPISKRTAEAATPAVRAHDLKGVSATLLVVLAARALAPIEAPELGFADPHAEHVLQRLEVDARQFGLKASAVRAVVLRAQWFNRTIRGFFERYPQGLCINIGCGLTPSFEQVADAGGSGFGWIDLDLPEVIELRRRFFADTARRRTMEGDVTDPSLFARLPWAPGEPAIIAAEGLLYYLPPAQVEAFFAAQAHAAGARRAYIEVAFDYASPLGAWMVTRLSAHRRLGTACLWTLRRASDLRRIDPRLEVAEDSNVFLAGMGLGARQLNALYRFVTGGGLGGCAHLRRFPDVGLRPSSPEMERASATLGPI